MTIFHNKNKGIALFFTICTLAVISIMVAGMIFFMRGEVHLSENYVDGAISLMLAEAGIEETLFTIRSQMNDPEHPFYKLVTNEDSGSVEIDLSRLADGTANVAPLVEGGQLRAKVSWEVDQRAIDGMVAEGIPREIARKGTVTINSLGQYHRNKTQIEVKKELRALLIKGPETANAVGMVAPEHGFYMNTGHRDSFNIAAFDFFNPWSFTVLGGRTYMEKGATIDLPKWLMMTKLRDELDNPWLDMGIGWTGWTGGGDFADTSLEYTDAAINRRYNKWQGLFNWPWWRKTEETYHSDTRRVERYDDRSINVYSAETYRMLANRMVDPRTNPSHAQHFTDVNFKDAFGQSEVTYQNVVPLYGWGDWRNVPNQYSRWFGNPTKAFDTSRAVEINGLTYIRGDVFLEGWVKGQGLLVVQGNVYVGGDVLMLPDDAGNESCLGLIVLREDHDTSHENPSTGQIIYKPHHDSDWSRFGITHPFRNLSPRLEGSFYAEGGMRFETDSSMEKLTRMDIVGNLVVDYFDRQKMPNDVRITHYNWQEVLERSSYDYSVDRKIDYTHIYELAITKELLSWRQVPATL